MLEPNDTLPNRACLIRSRKRSSVGEGVSMTTIGSIHRAGDTFETERDDEIGQ